MLNIAVHRMKQIESDFQGCLNWREEEDPKEHEVREFEKSRVSFKLMNNVILIFSSLFSIGRSF